MLERRPDVLTEELARVTQSARVPLEILEGLFRNERAGVAPAPWSETEVLKSLGKLLVAVAEELEEVALDESDEEAARGGLLALATVAGLLEVPRLGEWAGRLSQAAELPDLAADAARMLRGEAFEMVLTQSRAELRECQWRWPERRAVVEEIEEPEPEEAALEVAAEISIAPPVEPELEPVEEVASAAEVPGPLLAPEPAPEPEPKAAPPPAPAARPRSAPPRRALVADPSAIAAGFLARILMSQGLAVTMAESPERMAAELARSEFSFVFAVAEWPVPANRGHALIIRLFAEEANPRVAAGERYLLKPPAEEEVNQILATWSGRHASQEG